MPADEDRRRGVPTEIEFPETDVAIDWRQLTPQVRGMAQRSFGDWVSQVLGWSYFLCWTISFYPQVISLQALLTAGDSELPKKVSERTQR